MSLGDFIKSQGFKGVKWVAEEMGVSRWTLYGWYQDDNKRENVLKPRLELLKQERRHEMV